MSAASSRRAVAASQGGVAEIAAELLARGNAVDAVVAGVLGAAALEPSVLLGPVQVLVGGAGAGLRAIDGRCLQPGVRASRPRGFVAGAAIPPAARVATPVLPAALATAVASLGSASFAQVAAPAVKAARGLSEARAGVLERVAGRGAAALLDARVADELVAAVGKVAGGLLGRADLEAARPVMAACAARATGERRVLRAPWADDSAPSASVHVVVATDARGLVAVACYEAPLDGVPIPDLGLVAPAFAAPVTRGEPRVRPGEPRPAACPIALAELDSVVDVAAGASGADAAAALDAFLSAFGRGEPLDVALAASPTGLRGVARSRGGARAFTSQRS
jgi:hypothetical protein